MATAVETQLGRCHIALSLFNRCMKDRKWNKVLERSDRIVQEMDLLRLKLTEHPNTDDELIGQIKYLDIQLRRIQRQFFVHIGAVGSDLSTLNRGINRAEAAKALLQAG